MGDNEWVRLTPEDRDEGWGIFDYRHCDDEPFDHALRWMHPPHEFEVFTYLTDAELRAIPPVAALVEAAQLAKTWFDAARLESGLGSAMLRHEKDAFRQADEAVTAALRALGDSGGLERPERQLRRLEVLRGQK